MVFLFREDFEKALENRGYKLEASVAPHILYRKKVDKLGCYVLSAAINPAQDDSHKVILTLSFHSGGLVEQPDRAPDVYIRKISLKNYDIKELKDAERQLAESAKESFIPKMMKKLNSEELSDLADGK